MTVLRAPPWLAPSAGRRAVPARFMRLLSVLLAVAPGASAAPPASPLSPIVSASVSPAASARDARSGSLPRQFSIEVGPGGVLVADGTRLTAAAELDRWARRALDGARFSGAVVFGDEGRDGAVIGDVVERLRRVGFAEVRRAGRAAPPELSALARAGAAPVVAERAAPAARGSSPGAPSPGAPSPAAARPAAPAPSKEPRTSAPAAAPRAPAVTLATVGLHVDGLLNREPHRSRLVRVFEREFKAFRRCHERAERHEQGASYGVDLLIPKNGGRGKVREVRSRLASKGFRSCMQAAFEAIQFAPPPSERPEIVSYSVLFKPSVR